jgi:hypothetical protein
VRYGPATTTGQILPFSEAINFFAAGWRKNRPAASHCRNGRAAAAAGGVVTDATDVVRDMFDVVACARVSCGVRVGLLMAEA